MELLARDPTTGLAHVDVAVSRSTGSPSVRIPIPLTPGRDGHGPDLALVHGGHDPLSPFPHGWSLSGLPSIDLDTRDGLPRYDGRERHVFGGQELIPIDGADRATSWSSTGHDVRAFRLRVESSPMRAERWTRRADGRVHWRVRTPDGAVMVFGRRSDGETRIEEGDKTYRWLLEASHDRLGNAMVVRYRPEDDLGVDPGTHEAVRFRGARANRYIDRILYGNETPLGVDERIPESGWHLEVRFDYGGEPWPVRQDVSMTARPGFEVRTRRLCRRVVMIHHFEAELGEASTEVGALELRVREAKDASTLEAVRYVGYRSESIGRMAIETPWAEIAYGERDGDEAFEARSLPWMSAATRLADLYGEGLPGLLTMGPGGAFYSAARGTHFEAPRALDAWPTGLDGAVVEDFDRDGDPELAQLSGPAAGYYRLDRRTKRWERLARFDRILNVTADRVSRVDLTGDGRADLVVWHAQGAFLFENRGAEGFAEPIDVAMPPDRMPRVDRALDRFLADMTGDGLADLVEVLDGSVRYWPNLGHGRFGDVVVMDDAPRLDAEASFDSARVMLLDLGGTGACDLVYLRGDGAVVRAVNQRGVRFGPLEAIAHGAPIPSRVVPQLADVHGDGSVCLAYVAATPAGDAALNVVRLARSPGARRIVEVRNALGAITTLEWGHSTAHYLRDVATGRGWDTPMPAQRAVIDAVHLVEPVDGAARSERYRYHDGHYDREERAFSVFAVVEHLDVDPREDLETDPLSTRQLFHTGEGDYTSRFLQHHYAGDLLARPPPEARVVDGSWPLSAIEEALAMRALTGALVGEETYAADLHGEPVGHPFTVTRHQPVVRPMRAPDVRYRIGVQRYGAASVTAQYERAAEDPRTTLERVLAVDAFLVARQAITVGLPRRIPRFEEQGQILAIAREDRFVSVDTPDRFEVGIEISARTFEVHFASIDDALSERLAEDIGATLAHANAYEVPLDARSTVRTARELSRRRTLYWSDDLTRALAHGQVGSVTLPHHEEQVAYDRGQLARLLGPRVDPDVDLSGLGFLVEDDLVYAPSPVLHYEGAERFHRLARTEAFDGGERRIDGDPHAFVIASVTDEVGNTTTAAIDYQLLAPWQLTDANGTIEEAQYDALGVVRRRSRRGTVLDRASTAMPYGFAAIDRGRPLPSIEDALADPLGALGEAEQLALYDFPSHPGEPLRTVAIAAEQFLFRGPDATVEPARVQARVAYFDGWGRAVQTRAKTDDGIAFAWVDGRLVEAPTDDRWRVSGWTRYDEKQSPVATYEPFFAEGAAYRTSMEERRRGVASVTTFDALGRAVRVTQPDGTFAETIHGTWSTTSYDANDTSDRAETYAARRRGPDSTQLDRMELDAALAHASTPISVHVDPFGHAIATVEVIEGGRELVERSERDVRGLSTATIDRRRLRASERAFDRLGRLLFERTMDGGATRGLFDALGRDVCTWREPAVAGDPETETRRAYDAAGRVTEVRVIEGASNTLVETYEFGERALDARARNQRGRLVAVHDGAGRQTFARYGAFGEVLEAERTLTVEIGAEPDWSGTVELEREGQRSARSYDALGRVMQAELPDGTRRRITYLESGPERTHVVTLPDGTVRNVLVDAEHDAHGRPARVALGNDVAIRDVYDPLTRRLDRSTAAVPGEAPVQDLRHRYDPVGNLIFVDDLAQRPGRERVIRGLTVTAERTYRYDARYQLVEATGRVHGALLQADLRGDLPPPGSFRGTRRIGLNDGGAVIRYRRVYDYDEAGNLRGWLHRPEGASPGARLSVEKRVASDSNRSFPAFGFDGLPSGDPSSHFDARGQLVGLPNVRAMEWSATELLRRVVLIPRPDATDDDERYDYAADRARVRKTRRRLVEGAMETVETVYLDGCELRRVTRGGVRLVRWTSHVERGGRRLADIHRWERDDDAREVDRVDVVRTHYPLSDHLGSVSVELGHDGEYLSYEEHFPFGRTSFVAGDAVREVRLRTIRFAGKDQDDATGFYCFQYRYYAPFIGNWVSPDPAGEIDGPNLYAYAGNNPVNVVDPDGLQTALATGPVIEDEQQALAFYNRTYARFHMRVLTDLEPLAGHPGQWTVAAGGVREMTEAEWEAELGSTRLNARLILDGGGPALPPALPPSGLPPSAEELGGGGDGDIGSVPALPGEYDESLDELRALDASDDPLAGLPGGGTGGGAGEPEAPPGPPPGGGGGQAGRGPGTGSSGTGTGAGRGHGEEGSLQGRGSGFGEGTHGERPAGGVPGGSAHGRGHRPGHGGGAGHPPPGRGLPPPPSAQVGERAREGAPVGTTTGTGSNEHVGGGDIGFAGGSDQGSLLGNASGGDAGDLLSGGEGGTEEATFEDSVNAIVGILSQDFVGYDPQDPAANPNGVTGGVLGLFDFGEATPYVAAAAAIALFLFGRIKAAKRAVKETLDRVGDAIGNALRGARDWIGGLFERGRRWFRRGAPPTPSPRRADPIHWGGEFIDDGLLPDTGTPSRGPRLGALRATTPGHWESTAGLRYGPEHPGSQFRNRVEHVLNHAQDIPNRPGPHGHGVFDAGRRGALADVDDAWLRVQEGVPGVVVTPQGNRMRYDIPMGRRVGFVGGQFGAANHHPEARWIRLVVGPDGVVTAFPVSGP
ncbi:MAG: SpvB/TcaC N-terminal domain-containing protein [Sandaracinaceae bacterium]